MNRTSAKSLSSTTKRAFSFVVLAGLAVASATFFATHASRGDDAPSAGQGRARVVAIETADSQPASKGLDASAVEGKWKVLVVGVNDYDDEDVPDLEFAEKDARDVADAFVKLGVAKEDVDVVDNPTKRNIDRHFSDFFASLAPGDKAVIFMSGHGAQLTVTVRDGEDESFFIPKDFKPRLARYSPRLYAVSIDRVMRRFKESPAALKWMIVDACRNELPDYDDEDVCADSEAKATGRPFKSAPSNRVRPQGLNLTDVPESVVLLQSCKRGEVSLEWDGEFDGKQIQNGLFTYSLVEALNPNASPADVDGNGAVTFLEFVKYVANATNSRAKSLWERQQIPYFIGDATDFDLFYPAENPVVAKTSAQELFNEANRLVVEKKYVEARAKIKSAVELEPDNPYFASFDALLESLIQSASQPTMELAAKSPSREAGARKVVNINGVKVAFRWCPAGRFTMGSPEDEEDRDNDENQHEVVLTHGFWLAETETTQALWTAVMSFNPSEFTGYDLRPVENVSWDDCQEFVRKLNGLAIPDVGEFRLPTEAEWEYACRAGTTTAYFWGNALNGDKANCDGTFPCGTTTEGERLEETRSVGRYEANAWGLLDMHGNVWEWCADWYGDYPEGAQTDPQGEDRGSYRVLRGGSFYSYAWYCRSAFRSHSAPTCRYEESGFRLAMTDEEMNAQASAKSREDPSTDLSSRVAGARKVITVNGMEAAFRWCPSGRFTMGSPEDEEGRRDNETQHEVVLTHGFWLAETETTQAVWTAIMGENPSAFVGNALLPVEKVSWHACRKAIQKLNALKIADAGTFRLPTEAEWEYACRAGAQTAYPWGAALNGDKANCNGAKPCGTETPGENLGKPTRVGSYAANAWGLFDMNGNVGEWCADRNGDYSAETQTDPLCASESVNRVVRGGSWVSDAERCRSASRFAYVAGYGTDYIGFRLAMTDEEQE